jgi:hypothetical protein
MITMGFLVAGLLFLRFWARTRDGIFIAFAVSFALLAANQALVALSDMPREEYSKIYLLRVAAFATIIGAIVWKNRHAAGAIRRRG